MNFGKEITFAIATLGETVNPGPTLAVLMAACFIGRRQAWGVAVGVLAANCVWLALSVMVGAAILTNQIAVQIFTILGATALVYLATRGLINNTLSFFFLGPAGANTPPHAAGQPRFGLGLQQGFLAHLMNPLSFTYYSGLYTTTALNEPGRIWLFGLIAVASDLLVYGIIASLPVSKLNIPNLLRRLVGLIASFALLTLVARVFSRPLHMGYPLLVGLTTLFMLIGFLVGALIEAERLVAKRANIKRAGHARPLLNLSIKFTFKRVLTRQQRSANVGARFIASFINSNERHVVGRSDRSAYLQFRRASIQPITSAITASLPTSLSRS